MKFTVLGGGNEIGANAYLVEMDGLRLMLDAGVHPRRTGYNSLPDFRPIEGRPVDALLLSHCHLDHLGALPVALRSAPHARVFMARPSYDLAPEMLHSTVTVMERQRIEQGIREYPLYTHDDVEMVSYCFQGMSYDRDFPIYGGDGGGTELSCRFLDAGHILGASGILLRGWQETVFYTGDTSRSDQEILKGAIYPDEPVHTLILEATLGANEEAEDKRRSDEARNLARHITRVVDRGGSVLIPAFALGRTQEMLATLHRLRSEGRMPDVEIFTAGMGRSVSHIYDRTTGHSRRRNPDLRIGRLDIRSLPPGDPAHGIHMRRPSVIVVSSGMMEAGTLSYRIAKAMLPDPRHAIFFVGYVDPNAPGYRVLNARPGDRLPFDPGEDPVDVRCEVRRFHFSAHANRGQLLRLVEELTPSRVILTHGDSGAIRWMAESIREGHPWIEILTPEPGITYDLPASGG